MSDKDLNRTRAANLWEPFSRKFAPVAKACELDVTSSLGTDDIGGLDDAKEEVATYACAATDPQIYARWGTVQPSGLLFIGPAGSGKTLLARALATLTETPYLGVNVPRFVLQLLHVGGNAAEILTGWEEVFSELPPITVFFDELDFHQALAEGPARPGLPTGPIGDFLLELVDATVNAGHGLVVGSTSHADTLSRPFLEPGRFERIVGVNPQFPGDVVAALEVHARQAEGRASRTIFEGIDWTKVVEQNRDASTGNWVRLLHATLRRKARCEAASEQPGPVTTNDFLDEVDRFKKATTRLPHSVGRYL